MYELFTLRIYVRIRMCVYTHTYVHILYFACADQRDQVYCIFHKVARVLYGKYSTVMQVVVVVLYR